MALRSTHDQYARQGERWTEQEVEIIMASNKSDRDISKKIKRSIASIVNKRHDIRKERKKKQID